MEVTLTTALPTMSKAASEEREIKVLTLEVAMSVMSLMILRSAVPRLMVMIVESAVDATLLSVRGY